MDSERDVRYRLRLAEGFLGEAEEDVRSSRWRSCVDNAQLAVSTSRAGQMRDAILAMDEAGSARELASVLGA